MRGADVAGNIKEREDLPYSKNRKKKNNAVAKMKRRRKREKSKTAGNCFDLHWRIAARCDFLLEIRGSEGKSNMSF